MKKALLTLFRRSHRRPDDLGLLPGHLRCAQRRHAGRHLPHHLLPRTLGIGSVFCSSLSASLGSIGYLAFRRSNPDRAQIADAWALAGAEVGVVFCTVVLTTGPLWGRRAWGIWWTWDARLTTTLVLWLIYVSYLLLRRFAAGPQMQTLAAVLGIFGALDVPIVYMSNRWWRTQHPAPVFGGAPGSGMAPSMVDALLWNMLAWFCWGLLVLFLRYKVERRHQQYAALEAEEALAGVN